MKKFAILLFLVSFTGAHAAENKGVPGKNAPVVQWGPAGRWFDSSRREVRQGKVVAEE